MQGVSKNIAVATAFVAFIGAVVGCGSSMNPDEGSKANGASDGSGGKSGVGGDTSASGAASTFPKGPLSTFMTPDKMLQIELRTLPRQPIQVGPNNQGELHVTDAATGADLDGLAVTVTDYMPVMHHKCSEAPIKVKAQGNGLYLLTPLVASMPGDCELNITVSMPAPDGGKGAAVSVTSPTFNVTQPE
jgi:hypothetical protein